MMALPTQQGFVFVPAPYYRKASEWLLVLRAVGLDGVIRPTNEGGWGLLLVEEHAARAIENIKAYEAENQDWPPQRKPDRPLYERSLWAALTLLSLGLFFLTTGPSRSHSKWFEAGIASTDQLLHGKPWQAVTALTLHADAQHMMSNAIAGTLFLTAVHRRLGAGLGTFAVLAAGAAGNALNAAWHVTGHRSLGASTAVFGAVGVLAATQALLNRDRQGGFFATWGPIVGGLALLGSLGAGVHTDLHAHLFGFLAGLASGGLAGLWVRRREVPLPDGVQIGFGALSAATVLGSWGLAFWRHLGGAGRRPETGGCRSGPLARSLQPPACSGLTQPDAGATPDAMHARALLGLLVAFVISPLPACSEDEIALCEVERPARADWRLRADGTTLRDAHGRRVLLRGVNAGGRSKFAPYAPFDFQPGNYDASLGAYLDRAATWGLDALRVPFSWAALEPQPGVIDEAYLARYDALLDAAWARGMWTLVDFHQDIYAEALCGDGFPDWTLPEPRPAPGHDCPQWFLSYTQSSAVKSAFDRFWTDELGTRTAFRAMWKLMAARHRDRPGVIGFEIINEPSPGSTPTETWERDIYSSFLGEMTTQLRADAPRTLVFFDVPGDAFLSATSALSPPREGAVFAPHWYEPLAFLNLPPNLGGVQPDLKKIQDLSVTWGVPMLLGESGVKRSREYTPDLARAIYAAVDALDMSFTYWEYSAAAETWNREEFSVVAPDGQEETGVLDQLARPYPRAIAGGPPTFRYDAATREFHLSYDADAGGVSEVALPRRTYPIGVEIEATGACAREDGDVLLIKAASAGRVEITLRPGT